jgi:hypothetical protein
MAATVPPDPGQKAAVTRPCRDNPKVPHGIPARIRKPPRPDGTEIRIVQTLHPTGIVIIVTFLILGLVLWSRAGYYGGAALFTAGLFVLHGVMYCIGFVLKARRAEKRIRQLAA